MNRLNFFESQNVHSIVENRIKKCELHFLVGSRENANLYATAKYGHHLGSTWSERERSESVSQTFSLAFDASVKYFLHVCTKFEEHRTLRRNCAKLITVTTAYGDLFLRVRWANGKSERSTSHRQNERKPIAFSLFRIKSIIFMHIFSDVIIKRFAVFKTERYYSPILKPCIISTSSQLHDK